MRVFHKDKDVREILQYTIDLQPDEVLVLAHKDGNWHFNVSAGETSHNLGMLEIAKMWLYERMGR